MRFPGHGQMKLEQLEIERLRREVQRLKAERDILKRLQPTSRRNRHEVRLHREAPRAILSPTLTNMKILHVPNAYFPVVGGAENNCRRFSEILASQGHDVHVVTADVGAVQAYYEFGIPRVERAEEIIGGVSVTRLSFSNDLYQLGGWVERKLRPRWLSKQIAWRTMLILRRRLANMIMQKINQLRPDVVMAMPHLVANVQAVLAARQRVPFPLVLVPMLHEHDPHWDAKAMSTALRSANAVIALTSYERDRLATAYGVPDDRIFVASVGVDINDQPLESTERHQRVVFLGRKVKSKGISDLIDAMKLVWTVMPNVELWLAGVRVAETCDIDQQVAELPPGFRDRVKDVGTISDAQKADFLRSARCLVLPSKSESFGMVILEAWSQATPVVVWDLPLFRSIVDHDRTGVLADPAGGSFSLGKAILRILLDPAAAERMGEAGRRQAATTYSWDAVAASYLQAYRYAVRFAGNDVTTSLHHA
jgi:glycosyltransferase involved in cell wall biosynthesis